MALQQLSFDPAKFTDGEFNVDKFPQGFHSIVEAGKAFSVIQSGVWSSMES
jgi:hypothetical protein